MQSLVSFSLCRYYCFSLSFPLSLSLSLHLTYKPQPMHEHILYTFIHSAAITLTHKAAHHWVSGRWLPWQHIPSHVAAWSEVWCCWTSLLSLFCIAAFMLLYGNTTWHRPDLQMSTYLPWTFCYIVENRTTILHRTTERIKPFCFRFPLSTCTVCDLYVPVMMKPCLVLLHMWSYERHVVLPQEVINSPDEYHMKDRTICSIYLKEMYLKIYSRSQIYSDIVVLA